MLRDSARIRPASLCPVRRADTVGIQDITQSQAVSNAITEAYLRGKALDARTERDEIVLSAAHVIARNALAKAVDALRKHIEEHGCKK
jgi:hypothetical protein